MQAKAIAKNIRISPRKVRLVVNLVRGMSVVQARHQLMFLNKGAAKPVLKVLESALANAVNNNQMNADSLKIVDAFVDEGPTLHRFMPRAQGRATPLRKRSSHITFVVGDESEMVAVGTAPAAKKAEVAAAPAAEAEAKPAKSATSKKKTSSK